MTEKDSKLFINGQPVFVSEDGKFRENITLQSGVNVINVKSVNRFDKEANESVTIQSNFKDENSQEGNSQSNQDRLDQSDKQEIEIELRVDPGPVWISVESDDNLVFSGTMLSGTTQTFKAKDKISINSGKANATFVKFNGKDIGTLGPDAGAVRGVVFNRDTKY
jgi:hypothetical protein